MMKRKNLPNHAIPHEFHLCMDSRKNNCPFYAKIKVDTEDVSFDQGFCAYLFRKDLDKKPPYY
jgi:hypothetical protein